MDIDPEELQRLLGQTSAEWFEDANAAPLPIHFRAEVRTKLENIFGAYPSWELIKATLKRVYSDRQLEKTFIADLEGLYNNEDSFQWPLDDPHHCLLLGHMKDYYKRFMAKLSEDEDQDEDEEDEADWVENCRIKFFWFAERIKSL
jgi:hypothetical protein